MRRGLLLIEALVLLVCMAVMAVPILQALLSVTREVDGGALRLSMEIAARRAKAALVSLPYDACVTAPAQTEPGTFPSLGCKTEVKQLEAGLAQITSRLRYRDSATGNEHEVVVRRLKMRPTRWMDPI